MRWPFRRDTQIQSKLRITTASTAANEREITELMHVERWEGHVSCSEAELMGLNDGEWGLV